MHEGFTLAIVGRPNVGKSSLFNRLLQQERAIVTDIPGTTRDLVSETAALEGIPVRFVDTAGIREGQDVIEMMGIERSLQAMADADVTLVVVDRSAPLTAQDLQLIEKAQMQGKSLVAANKCDLPLVNGTPALAVSALTGEGFREMRRAIIDTIAPRGRLEQEGGFITNLRRFVRKVRPVASAVGRFNDSPFAGDRDADSVSFRGRFHPDARDDTTGLTENVCPNCSAVCCSINGSGRG